MRKKVTSDLFFGQRWLLMKKIRLFRVRSVCEEGDSEDINQESKKKSEDNSRPRR